MKKITLSDPKKEEKLISFLSAIKKEKDKFIVIFDGKNTTYPFESKHKNKDITQVFTDLEESADDYIIRKTRLIKQKDPLIVISSDHKIQQAAKHDRIAYLSSLEFLKTLRKHTQTIPEKPTSTPNSINYWLDQFQ